MSRIATLAAVLTMLVAPAAFGGQDLRSPDVRDLSAPALIDLRTPDAVTPMQAAGQDLRSPDAIDVFVPTAGTPSAEPGSSGVSIWGVLAIIAAAMAICGLLAVMLRRHLRVSRPVGV